MSMVCAASDPSVNHLWIVDSSLSPLATHTVNADTNSDMDEVSGIGAGSSIVYMLYASSAGHCHLDAEHETIFRAVVETLDVSRLSTAETDDSFTVVLASEPLQSVRVTAYEAMQQDQRRAFLGLRPNFLIFTPQNWNMTQSIAVDAVNDDVDDGFMNVAMIEHVSWSEDKMYRLLDAMPQTVDVVDDDDSGVRVSSNAVTVSENNDSANYTTTQATYTVVLRSQPLAPVSVFVHTAGGITAQPAELSFTAMD
eukprot:SAG31_NODE_15392_length_757_cov_1.458967_1_plen_252_part_11